MQFVVQVGHGFVDDAVACDGPVAGQGGVVGGAVAFDAHFGPLPVSAKAPGACWAACNVECNAVVLQQVLRGGGGAVALQVGRDATNSLSFDLATNKSNSPVSTS